MALTIKGLLRQRLKPDALVLWIDRGEVGNLPRNVCRLQEHGLTIAPCGHIGSFSKILHALEAHPQATIVTADDDCFYPPTWLEGLVAASAAAPDHVICYTARRMIRTNAGDLAPYGEWPVYPRGVGDNLMPRGSGGVLYPPRSLHADVMDIDAYRTLSPTADDLWLKWMSARAGTPVLVAPNAPERLSWPQSQRTTLTSVNVDQGGNDRQIRNLVAAYGMPLLP